MRQSPTNSASSSNYRPAPRSQSLFHLDSDTATASNIAPIDSADATQCLIASQIAAQAQNSTQEPSREVFRFKKGRPFANADTKEEWLRQREAMPGKKHKNLQPAARAKDLGQNEILSPAPSPLLNLLSTELFADKLWLVHDQNEHNIKVDCDSVEVLRDILHARRQMFKCSDRSKLSAFDNDPAAFVVNNLREMIRTTRQQKDELSTAGAQFEDYAQQVDTLRSFLIDRVEQKRIKQAQSNDHCIEKEQAMMPSDSESTGIDDIIGDFLPLLALDLLKAQDGDFTKRVMQAQQLVILIALL